MSVMRPELIMKSIIPVVMAGILAIYGLVVAVLIANGCKYNVVEYLFVCLFAEKFIYQKFKNHLFSLNSSFEILEKTWFLYSWIYTRELSENQLGFNKRSNFLTQR